MILGLLVTEGSNKGLYIRIPEKEVFWIGRNPAVDFVIESDPSVSQKHCYLWYQKGLLHLRDESRNGTRLNSRKLHQSWAVLKMADIFCVGDTHFQVVDVDPNAPTISTNFADIQTPHSKQESNEKATSPSALPMKIGEYDIIESVGSGGFGVVYKAVHAQERKLVALKVFTEILNSPGLLGRFLREASLLQRLHHPYLIELFETGQFELQKVPYPFIAMEFFPGVNLTHHLQVYGKMPWQKVCPLLIKIADALRYMHEKQILHRDLKPQNILYNDIHGVCKIVDFGLGKCITDEERNTFYVTKTGSGLGTPYYMPFEQWQKAKEVDVTADIYSLGATAYFLMSGNHPYAFCSNYLDIFEAMLKRRLLPLKDLSLPDTPQSFLNIIEKMMAFQAKDRYSSCELLLKDLRAIPEATPAKFSAKDPL